MKQSIIVLSFVLLLSACSDQSERTSQDNESRLPLSPATQMIDSFEAKWALPAGTSVAERAHAIAQVMLGGVSLVPEAFERTGADFVSNGNRWPTNDRFGPGEVWNDYPVEGSSLNVQYYSRYNDLRVTNQALRTSFQSGPDVGVEAAKRVFLSAFDDLAEAGVIDKSHYDLAKIDSSTTEAGWGKEGAESTATVEYTFGLLRQINGIDFANAGLRISVHRSGKLSAIRLGGARIRSARAVGPNGPEHESPLGNGRSYDVVVSEATIHSRHTGEFPNARLAWARPMYVLPDDADEAVIEPLYVFSFSNVYVVDGHESVSRRRLVGYSMREAAASPVYLGPPADPNATGDPRPETE